MTAFPGNIQLAPRRVFEGRQIIPAAPSRVFALLCPEMEKHWFPGWAYTMIHSASGYAEPGAVFATGAPAALTYWVVSEYRPAQRVAFVRLQPEGLAVHLAIDVEALPGGASAVRIVYTYTALTESGAAALAAKTEAEWETLMQTWEGNMKRWLEEHPEWTGH